MGTETESAHILDLEKKIDQSIQVENRMIAPLYKRQKLSFSEGNSRLPKLAVDVALVLQTWNSREDFQLKRECSGFRTCKHIKEHTGLSCDDTNVAVDSSSGTLART